MPPNLPPRPIRRKRGFEAASKLVAPHLRGALEKRGFAEARLLTHWEEIVGAEMASMASPVKTHHGRGNFGATLVLLVTGASAPMVEMQKEAIRAKVNACYGYNAVARITLTQTAATGFAEGQAQFRARPKAPAAPSPEVTRAAAEAARPIEDDRLKEALERLARNVLSKHRN